MSQQPNFSHLKALYINCTLKKSPQESHTAGLMNLSQDILKKEGVSYKCIRLVDYAIAHGVHHDMTAHGAEEDEWPDIFKLVRDADILVVGTPIWLGEKSSITTMLLERLYAESGKRNEKGQSSFYGKVGGCIVTGNEDGIKHVAMSVLYALQHVGYSIPPQADSGWIGEAGPGSSYNDKESGAKNNDFTNRNTTFMTYNLLHLALLLKNHKGYPSYGNNRDAWENGTKWNFINPQYR